MATTVVGDIIDIEHSTDGGSTYSVIGKTRGTVSINPNNSLAESSQHSSLQQDKDPVSEAWTIEFENRIVSDLGGLEEAGLYSSGDSELVGSAVSGSTEQIRITIYENEADKTGGTIKMAFETTDYIAELTSLDVEEDDYSIAGITIHSLERVGVPNTTA